MSCGPRQLKGIGIHGQDTEFPGCMQSVADGPLPCCTERDKQRQKMFIGGMILRRVRGLRTIVEYRIHIPFGEVHGNPVRKCVDPFGRSLHVWTISATARPSGPKN